jgi:hypothetical protein
LCSFIFADGHRCPTPRSSTHPRLCFDHAGKEAQAHPADYVRPSLPLFFSGNHVSADDLSADIAHGQISPKTASTLAYLSQILLRSIQLSEHKLTHTQGKHVRPGPVATLKSPPNLPPH